VGVLQYAERLVLGNEAQILIHLRVPRFREVGDSEAVLEEIHLELEAQEDMEVVGELVRLCPYLRRPDGVDGPVDGLDVAGDAGEKRDCDSCTPIEMPPMRGVRE
jgi:hypothetical protein